MAQRSLRLAVLAATLGLPLLIALATFSARDGSRVLLRVVLPVAALGALTAFYFVADRWMEPVLVRRYAQFSLGLHLTVAFLAFAGRNEPNGFCSSSAWP